MITDKVKSGRSFKGAVEYVTGKKEAIPISSQGLWDDRSPKQIIKDFDNQRKLNPRLGTAVWHAYISFDPTDKVGLKELEQVADEYVKEMGLENTQYLCVYHGDTAHKHLHILANRVGFDGKTISDSHTKHRSYAFSRKMEKKYGFASAVEDNRGNKLKETIKLTIDQNLAGGWVTIEKALGEKGITTVFNQTKAGHRSGVSFKTDKGVILKASQVHRSYSFDKINKKIEASQKKKGKGMEM